MSLSLHGLVIIAEDVERVIPFKYSTVLKLQVASDDNNGKTIRHMMDLYVPNDKVNETKEKLKVGTVCEITHGTWQELVLPGKEDIPAGKRYSKVELRVELKNFKILVPCIYYNEIDGVTQ